MAPTRVGRVVAAIAAVLALLAIAAFGGSRLFDGGPRYPARWDPRVAELAKFVEHTRGHPFKHPVHVYFMTDAEYSRVAGSGNGSPPTAADRRHSRRQAAEYRALGLLNGDPNLLASSEKLHDSGTLAFYSPQYDVVNVRGSSLTVGVRVTLAHELTHALQDQYFDLSPLDAARNADAAGAARSIVEGDAVATENAYIATLSDSERAAYDKESNDEQSGADESLGDVPKVLQTMLGSYYALGNAFVEFWEAEPNGPPKLTNIDEVLRRLPTASAQVIDPTRYLAGDTPQHVSPPRLSGRRDVFETATLGADLTFLMLAERIDPVVALTAVDGLRGDAYSATTVRSSDQLCVDAKMAMASKADAREMGDALEAWTRAMPKEASAGYKVGSDWVSFHSCDPGTSVDTGSGGASADALYFPVARLQAAAQAVSKGRSRTSALCYGNAVVERLTLADLKAKERTPGITAAIAAAEAACPR
ncbi:MAG: hypothetical protein U0Q22_01340 [Acidimicrobiales bacterium]